ncbi:LuxR C-terminal-related transcriptional regulator [Oceanobacillus rekensis]|uniref:LuxR C-terminal-related transcriptional regulator n=1 Tax=Oceanobacillus rekensis TaxID=937927 RepID=UPI001C3CB993|nr:LuxR C-terminal-related transcriptional regulator [Oceanobacillus rekensis]
MKELQHVYAAKFDFTIWMTDEKGEVFLAPQGENDLCNVLLNQEQDSIFKKVKESIQKTRITTPVLYDIFPGIYILANSIVLENGKKYYMWAGLMIEDQTQGLIKDQLQNTYGKEVAWDSILAKTPLITSGKKQGWMKRMEKLGELVYLLLTEKKDSAFLAVQNELFQQSVQERERGVTQLLRDFFAGNTIFEFIGLAEEKEDLYTVTEVIGEGIDAFRGAQFSPGEGFLGRVLLTGESDYWENIDRDPRSIFFKRHQFKPKSMLCFPIKQYDHSTKLLFCGNIHKEGFSTGDMEVGKTLAIMLETHSVVNTLQRENDEQLRRLSSLIEICKLMVSTPDMKKIVYILVDIGVNLVEGTFSCLILKDRKNDKVKLISRGNASHDIGVYAKDVVKRYLAGEKQVEIKAPQVYVTDEGERVVECPLFTKGNINGVLCVGIPKQSEPQLQEHVNFLETLSIIGGVSMQLAHQEEAEVEDNRVNTLYRAIEQFDKEAYIENEETANLAGRLAMKLGLDALTIKEIGQACRLSYYTPQFIREIFPNKKIDLIVKEGKELIEVTTLSWEEACIGSQVYALAKIYNENKALEAIPKQIQGIEMVRAFIALVRESQIVEQELTLVDENAAVQRIDSVTSTIKEMDLSPREQEVLDLVIQGLNNKEIAQELYISGHTVKNHVTKIFQKLDVPDRAHAISKVYQLKYHTS